jgi:hypothetical protein
MPLQIFLFASIIEQTPTELSSSLEAFSICMQFIVLLLKTFLFASI